MACAVACTRACTCQMAQGIPSHRGNDLSNCADVYPQWHGQSTIVFFFTSYVVNNNYLSSCVLNNFPPHQATFREHVMSFNWLLQLCNSFHLRITSLHLCSFINIILYLERLSILGLYPHSELCVPVFVASWTQFQWMYLQSYTSSSVPTTTYSFHITLLSSTTPHFKRFQLSPHSIFDVSSLFLHLYFLYQTLWACHEKHPLNTPFLCSLTSIILFLRLCVILYCFCYPPTL